MTPDVDIAASVATTELPSPPAGWFDCGYALLPDGNLALMRSDRDVFAAPSRRRAGRRGQFQDEPRVNEWGGFVRLSRFDGEIESGTVEVQTEAWSAVTCLADGRWLVASRRARRVEKNGRLFGADGAPAGAFALGDAIEHLCAATDGTIWVGYFDEGVGRGRGSISSSGIAQVGPDGTVLWRFNNGSGFFVIDCYAMTLDGPTLWCCPFPDFPIIRLDSNGIRHWENEVRGSRAFAVANDHVLLAGGYGEGAQRIVLLRLDQNRTRRVREWQLPALGLETVQLVQGSGSTLHIVGDRLWMRLTVAAVRAALGV